MNQTLKPFYLYHISLHLHKHSYPSHINSPIPDSSQLINKQINSIGPSITDAFAYFIVSEFRLRQCLLLIFGTRLIKSSITSTREDNSHTDVQ